MVKITITGGIGSGKSQVLEWFRNSGYLVLNADYLVQNLLQKTEVIKELSLQFGHTIMDSSGKLNKNALREIVFSHPSAEIYRKNLESIIHPKLKSTFESICNEVEFWSPDTWIVYEAALIIETGNYTNFDCVILVTSSYNNRIQRLKKRSNLSESDSKKIMLSQMDDTEKKKYSDIIIDNNSTVEDLHKRLEQLPGQIIGILKTKKIMPTAV